MKLFLVENYYDLRRKSSGGVQPNLNLGLIEAMALPLCSLEEAWRIQDEVEVRISLVDLLYTQLETELHRTEALRQPILKRAFSGKLVPHDQGDESASVLLERIRSETAAAGNGKLARKPRHSRKQIPDR